MFLTQEEKVEHLEHWREQRAKTPPKGDLAGKGYPDSEIYELTDMLNQIYDLCTTQSCAGHPKTATRDWIMSGQLWIRCTEEFFYRFVRQAHVLTACQGIEQVAVLWGRERDGPVIELTFNGLDCGPQELALSCKIIGGFFIHLAAYVSPSPS